MAMTKHFVTFFSPGTIFSETSRKSIDSWDVDAAVKMAADIVERHGARPYGFRFTTRELGESDLDSHESAHSGIYFLGGELLTLADVEARNDPEDSTLLSNMRGNNYARVIRHPAITLPFGDNDTLVEKDNGPTETSC